MAEIDDDDDDDSDEAPLMLRDEDDEVELAPAEPRPRSDLLLEHVAAAPPSAPPTPTPAEKKSPAAKNQPAKATQTKAGKGQKECPNCGALLPPDGMLCVDCGYHMVLGRVLQVDLGDVEIDRSVGFQRWFRGMLAEGESANSFFLAVHALVAALAIIVGLVFHPWSWLVVIPLLALYVGVFVFAFATGAHHRWAEKLWSVLLRIYRRLGWRRLIPPFSKRSVYQSRERSFGDAELAGVQSETIDVLDVEGTGITDACLNHLQNYPRLRFIVVRNTRMTKNGVLRLQIMKPELAIWQ
jgi:hypothetical protein